MDLQELATNARLNHWPPHLGVTTEAEKIEYLANALGEITQREDQIEPLENQIGTLQDEAHDLANKVDSRDDRIEKLEEQVESLTDERDALHKELKALKANGEQR